ncbi:unnamed protein product [Blepharisma stoltei]|uniref:Receptor ligand binding region domain-containing protein n=1 Tax=Blepharisma stoltei TaxID=1481888 RepID=A0AAU9JUX3_9CILI|nr:unnamed protein product [Blepharisma stoltei]
MKLWLFFLFIALLTSIDVFVVYDDYTSINIPLFKSSLLSSWSLSKEINAEFIDFPSFLNENPENIQIVIDLTSSFQSHFYISQLAWRSHFIHLTRENYSKAYTDWSFSLNLNVGEYFIAMKNVWQNLNWMKGAVFLSLESLLLRDSLHDQIVNNFYYAIIESRSGISEVINREVYNLGQNLYFLFTGNEVSEEIVKKLVETKLLSAGSGLFLTQESGYQVTLDGSLILTPRGQEYTTSAQESLIANIINLFDLLLEYLNKGDNYMDCEISLKNAFISLCENHFCTHFYSLVNIQSGKRVYIADAFSSNFSSIIFPEGNTIVPYPEKKKISFSISSGIYDSDSSIAALLFLLQNWGVFTAVAQVNGGTDLIPNFSIETTIINCWGESYEFQYSYKCFGQNIAEIGVMHIPTTLTELVLGTINIFDSLNITIPIIPGLSNDNSLSSSELYPYFSRTTYDWTYVINQSLKLIYTLGWRNCAVVYQNESFLASVYSEFIKTAKEYNVNILNREDLRAIPQDLMDYNSLLNYSYIMQEVIDSNAKLVVIIIFSPINIYIMDVFYDLGIRKGDFVIFWATTAWINYIYQFPDQNLTKTKEVSLPSLSLDQPAFVGEVGNWVNSQLLLAYEIPYNCLSCWSYDSTRLVINALDYMINRGLDYSNGTLLMSAIRKQNFSGCSGSIRIEPDNNNRFINSLVVKNAILNESSGQVILEEIGNWAPSGNTLLIMNKPIVYYGNSSGKPNDFRIVLNNCNFRESQIKPFMKGRYLMSGIGIIVVVWTCFITFCAWKRWSQVVIPELVSQEEASIQDFIMGATIIIEFFQLLMLGPSIKPISPFLYSIGDALSLNFDEFITVKNGIFWIIIDFVFGGVFIWVVLSVIVLLNLGEKKFWGDRVIRKLNDYAEDLIPILGNLCFIPFISLLMDVFVCDKAIGDRFTDSFMMKDCYQFCWKDEHLIYSIFSGIAIILYEPLAVFFRPLWQEMHTLAHVKYLPIHLMEKSLFQIIFIVLNKTVKRAQSLAYGIIFTIISASYAIFTLKYKAYNYERFSWWLSLSLFGVSWGSILATIKNETGDNSFIWVILLLIGWSLIIGVGITVQQVKYPSFLYRAQSINTEKLYQFAFSFTTKNIFELDVADVNFLT